MANNTRTLIFATAVLGAAFGGLIMYVVTQGSHIPQDFKPAPANREAHARMVPGQELQTKRNVRVFTPRQEGDEVKLDGNDAQSPAGEDQATFAVNQFLQSSRIVDAGAKLLSVEHKGNLAILHFNPAFARSYGAIDEKTLLDGLRKTLGQFPDVEKISFVCEGEAISTLGNVDLLEPLTVLR